MSFIHSHQPVMCQRALEALRIRADGFYCDCTYGRGGHSASILGQLSSQGHLLAIDRDADAVAHARAQWGHDSRVDVVHRGYAHLSAILAECDEQRPLMGILLDAGVSSPQLDDAERGFSFRYDAPLDMRMDRSQPLTAADWLASVDPETLATTLRDYGEERSWRRLTDALVAARSAKAITTTGDLLAVITRVKPIRPGVRKHPATQTFQAIRMVINDELGQLAAVMPQAVDALAPGGRLVVITFHSLETRLVKHFIQAHTPGNEGMLDRYSSGYSQEQQGLACCLRRIGGPQKPSDEEIKQNARARSAVMRIVEKYQ